MVRTGSSSTDVAAVVVAVAVVAVTAVAVGAAATGGLGSGETPTAAAGDVAHTTQDCPADDVGERAPDDEEDERDEEEEDEEDEDEEEEEEDEADDDVAVSIEADGAVGTECERVVGATTTVAGPDPPVTRTAATTTSGDERTTTAEDERTTASEDERTTAPGTERTVSAEPTSIRTARAGTTARSSDGPEVVRTTTESGVAVFTVTAARVSARSVASGSSVFVVAHVENHGDGAGEFIGRLRVDGEVRETRRVTIASGASKTIRFRLPVSDPGRHTVSVNYASAGLLSVVDPERTPEATGSVSVTEPSLEADWVRSGYETAATVVLRNDAGRAVTHTLTVTVDGAVVARETVRLDPEERRRVRIPFDAVGGDVAVDGVPAGELVVSDRRVAVERLGGVDGPGDGGFELGLVLAGVLGVIFVAGIAVSGRVAD